MKKYFKDLLHAIEQISCHLRDHRTNSELMLEDNRRWREEDKAERQVLIAAMTMLSEHMRASMAEAATVDESRLDTQIDWNAMLMEKLKQRENFKQCAELVARISEDYEKYSEVEFDKKIRDLNISVVQSFDNNDGLERFMQCQAEPGTDRPNRILLDILKEGVVDGEEQRMYIRHLNDGDMRDWAWCRIRAGIPTRFVTPEGLYHVMENSDHFCVWFVPIETLRETHVKTAVTAPAEFDIIVHRDDAEIYSRILSKESEETSGERRAS